jgi:transcriptional regulator with XRE-family HTH domain
MVGSGRRLRTIRLQAQLSLRQVEERSLRFAQKWGDQAFQISASWLNRLEREEHELTAKKLFVLADIFNVSSDNLLRCLFPGTIQPNLLKPFSIPSATVLFTEGPLKERAKALLPDMPGSSQPPDETTLLSAEDGAFRGSYRQAIIGMRDLTLDPMIPAGSIIQIDTQQRAISSRKDWTHEFQRPIYFLATRDGYVCGWCELDRTSDWLTLVPHTLSPASCRRWRYRKEVESLGRVIFAAIRLAP